MPLSILSLEEAAVHAGRKVLMEVVDNSLLIVGGLWEILGDQFRPHLICLLNIIIDIIFIIY